MACIGAREVPTAFPINRGMEKDKEGTEWRAIEGYKRIKREGDGGR